MKELKFAFLFTILFSLVGLLNAQSVDTLDYLHPIVQMKHLQPGMRKYLVYSEDSVSGKRMGVYIWERNILPFQKKIKNITIEQKWFSLDTQFIERTIYSVVDAHNFLPVLHHSSITAFHRPNYIEYYLFTPDSIYTDTSISQKKFHLLLQQPVYNWELDLETFSILPLSVGKKFAIYFYHPGSASLPQYYTYIVEQLDTIQYYTRNTIHCFRLKVNYPNSNNYSIWWIDKETYAVIRMKEYFNGKFRYKILLSN